MIIILLLIIRDSKNKIIIATNKSKVTIIGLTIYLQMIYKVYQCSIFRIHETWNIDNS